MKIKIKITYVDYNQVVMAKIISVFGWYELSSQIQSNGINESGIVKIDRVFEPDEINIIDTTKI